MRTKLLFFIAGIGILMGLLSAYAYGQKIESPPPIASADNPYKAGIYATGILESRQNSGANVNVFPFVSGNITQILVQDGAPVKKGTPLFTIDDSIQKEIVKKDLAQVQAALTQLQELKAQPRKENLVLAETQMAAAKASWVEVQAQLEKTQAAYHLNPKAISKNVLDNAMNNANVAKENFNVAVAQYKLVKAGAWIYDIQTQEQQYQSALKVYQSDVALLARYTVTAPADGVVLSVNAALGDYISPVGAYNTYNKTYGPVVELGVIAPYMEVRCFVSELLVTRLPEPKHMHATMFIRGQKNLSVPLQFVRIQPHTIPNIQLSDERNERVDVRVLPVIFRFKKPTQFNVYAGQLVDIYIKERP